jgi:pSer/pThr/pTyr-binding forkhead associated (FHA) protein
MLISRSVSTLMEDDFDCDSTIVGEHSLASVARQSPRRARLEQIRGPGAPRDFELRLEETIVGRATTAHISIVSNLLSRQHVKLKKAGEQVVIEDMDSANGMYLNGVKAHSATLHQGDQLQVGDVVFTFHEGE